MESRVAMGGGTHEGLTDGGHRGAMKGVAGEDVDIRRKVLLKCCLLWGFDGRLARDDRSNLRCCLRY